MKTPDTPICLMHVTTVPKALRYFVGQIQYVQQQGFDVEVITSPGDSLEEIEQSIGTKVNVIPMSRAITPLRDLKSLWRIYRTMRKLKPDIVHAHTPKAGYLGMLAAWMAGVPVKIYHIRGLRFETMTGFRRQLLRRCEQLACAVADQVLCVGRSVQEVAISEQLVPRNKIKVLLNGSHGLDAQTKFNPQRWGPEIRAEVRNQYQIPADATVIGFVGRLVRDKGIAELTEAWQLLAEKHPKLHLLVVGPFEDEDPVPAEAREVLKNHPRIHAIGSNWDTPRLFSAMDIVCLPTYREGLPRVPLEAAAMELPVVATQIPGCVDAVCDGVNGLLVPPRDSQALADALEQYVTSPELRKQHGQAGRRWVLQAFSPELMCEAVYEEYCSHLEIASPPALKMEDYRPVSETSMKSAA